MDLWIRSQDRENTVKIINQYGLKHNDKKTIIANYQPDFTDKYDGYYEILGTYKTEERALEVLDEIQKFISIDVNEKSISYENADLILKSKIFESLNKIYTMPKE